MTLIADVQARIPSQTLIEWTNQRDATATSVNTTLLQSVCDDVESDLAVELGYTYGAVNVPARDAAWMRAQGVIGVQIRLEMYATIGSDDLQKKYDRWIESLQRRRRRATIHPGTNAAADVEVDGGERRPDFDRREQGGWLAGRDGTVDPSLNNHRVTEDS